MKYTVYTQEASTYVTYNAYEVEADDEVEAAQLVREQKGTLIKESIGDFISTDNIEVTEVKHENV